MPYSITIDDARHYISIAITSQVTMDERGAALRDVVALLETTGYKCVLVDFRNGATLAATAAVKQRHATELARQYTAHFGVRLAYACLSRGHSMKMRWNRSPRRTAISMNDSLMSIAHSNGWWIANVQNNFC